MRKIIFKGIKGEKMKVKRIVKRVAVFTLIVMCACLFFVSTGSKKEEALAFNDEYITVGDMKTIFPDEYLRNVILSQMGYNGKPDDHIIYVNAFTYITTLNIMGTSDHEIDLTGIDRLTKLRYLFVGSPVKSLKPLNSLPELHTFKHWGDGATGSQISLLDIKDVKTLANLELYHVNLRTLDGVTNFTNLQYLRIEGCYYISDISMLSSLRKLSNLDITGCSRITDASVLASMHSLHTLRMIDAGITDISSLKNKTTMKKLDITGCDRLFSGANYSKNMEALLSLSNLEELHIRSVKIKQADFEQICNKLLKLKTLDLLSNKINNIDCIKKLTYIERLDLGANYISDFSPLSSLSNLKRNSITYSATGRRTQIISLSQKGNLVKNPFIDMYGQPVVLESNDDCIYDKNDNTILFNTSGEIMVGVMPIKLEKDTVNMELYINCTFEASPITIKKEPSDVVCTAGAPITLSVTAVAENSKLEYQWYKGDVKIADGTSSTYTIKESELSDAGSYKCVINGYMATATTREAKVTVNKPTDKVVIVKQPTNVSCYEKEIFTLSVKASSLDTNYTYKWYKDGVLMPNEKSATITVKNASISDSGKYKCEVSNSESTAMSNEAKVEVKEKIYTEPPTGKPGEKETTIAEAVTEEVTTEEASTERPSLEETTSEESTEEESTSEEITSDVEETTEEESSTYEEETTETEIETVEEEETTSDNNSDGQGKNNLLIYFVVGLIIIFILVAIILFIIIYKKKRNDENNKNNTGSGEYNVNR